ncbi:hypothetical protein ASE04_12705 [Rhizobium sp. Root708]|nr:hypothetical protein ASE04_12705 [Rhizobium sp. Root708]
MFAEIKTTRRVDEVLQLSDVSNALLIQFDGDRSDPACLLGALLYSEFIADGVQNQTALAQIIAIQGFIVAAEVPARHHNILYAVAFAKRPRSESGASVGTLERSRRTASGP